MVEEDTGVEFAIEAAVILGSLAKGELMGPQNVKLKLFEGGWVCKNEPFWHNAEMTYPPF